MLELVKKLYSGLLWVLAVGENGLQNDKYRSVIKYSECLSDGKIKRSQTDGKNLYLTFVPWGQSAFSSLQGMEGL